MYKKYTMHFFLFHLYLSFQCHTHLHPGLKELAGNLWIPAGTVNVVDYSPLIHLASGSWALNSGLNRSSTVSLVSLPAWLSTTKISHKLVNCLTFLVKSKYHMGVKCSPLIRAISHSSMHIGQNQSPAFIELGIHVHLTLRCFPHIESSKESNIFKCMTLGLKSMHCHVFM